jgi:hypothetical protein
MKSKVTKKVTYKQLMNYITVLETQVKNNQQAVYDISGILGDYVEMRGRSKALNSFMRKKQRFGSSAQKQTGWSKFSKLLNSWYLQLKKMLDS